jgi:hypothetical protein
MAKDFDCEIRADTGNDANTDNGTDLGGDIAGDDGVDLNGENNANNETSALSNILTAGANGLHSPSDLALIAGAYAPPNAEDASARLVQAGYNVAVEGSKEYMGAEIRQHGLSPAAELNNLEIEQAIDNASEPLDEPLHDNEDYYDENGVMITDEKLRE